MVPKTEELISTYFYGSFDDIPLEARVEILCKGSAYVRPSTNSIDVLEIFRNKPELQVLPVVDQNNEPLGLIPRSRLIEAFSGKFAHDVYSRKTISHFVDEDALIVDKSCTIDDLARIIVAAGMRYMTEGFIITEANKYLGVGTGHDLLNEIIERKQAHLFKLAHYDPLTGLPNRNLFMDRLKTACRDQPRNGVSFAVLFIDMDRFKFVNDTLGHTAGDELLRAVATRLNEVVRGTDTVARFGGDEFTVLLKNVRDARDVTRVVEKLMQRLLQPYELAQREFTLTASIGIALAESGENDVEELINKADKAMYSAKVQGKNNFKFFQPAANASSNRPLQLEYHLRKAISSQEFQLHFQPIVNAVTGSVVGAEALIRWCNPVLGKVSPTEFIPLAEEIGLIQEIGDWVLKEACEEAARWTELNPSLKVSVNLSGRQLTGPDLVEKVSNALAKSGLPPQRLKLEITENVILASPDLAISILERIKQTGVEISLDDFGTGYSSLSYLKRLPIGELKIDRSFVIDIVNDAQDEAIVKSIVQLTGSLGVKTVVEGVETKAHLDKLKSLGCDYFQGYYFSEPLEASAFIERLELGALIPAA